jgi:hypothetical protein
MPFDFQPCLQGGLLELRPLREEDFGDLCAVAADPLIWEQHPNKDRYQEAVFKGFFKGALDSQSALTVIDGKDHRIIGSSRYHGYDEKRGEIEIGWTFLARSHWGGTCNRELKRLMLHHAFKFVSSAHISSRAGQPPLAACCRENRWSAIGFKNRREWTEEPHLPDRGLQLDGCCGVGGIAAGIGLVRVPVWLRTE